jgi:hypothetical protein
MRLEPSKSSLGVAWTIALGALAVSDVVTSRTGLVLLLGFGFVPVVGLWFWTPPAPTLSDTIRNARD